MNEPILAAGPPGWQTEGQRQPQYTQQYGYQPPPAPEQQPVPPGESTIILTVLGIVAALGAVMVFVSTFLPWVAVGGASQSGNNLMTMTAKGNFAVRWGWGGILFTGIFSLIIGGLMIIPVILLLLNKRSGASWGITLGVIGFFIALVNVIMIYATYNGASAGGGLWVFLGGSIVLLACGIIGLRFSPPNAC
ncbi:MAG: hypothetical protein ACYC99_11150 [Candidatus Geothermincolia bacterium]